MCVNISAQKHHFRIQVPTREILLIKAAQARPFVETAQRLGVPVRSLAHARPKCHLGRFSPEKAQSANIRYGDSSNWSAGVPAVNR